MGFELIDYWIEIPVFDFISVISRVDIISSNALLGNGQSGNRIRLGNSNDLVLKL